MIDINKKLQQFLSTNDESEILEYKEAKNQYDLDKIGKYFSALSNEANLVGKSEAWLVFGIKDDKSVVGTNFRADAKSLHNLKAEVANHTTNRITFKEIYETEIDGKRVVLFQIPSAPHGIPIAWKGHYYGRDSSELQPLNIEEQERIRNQNNDFDWSIQICEDATIDDLSNEAIQKARELYAIKNPKLIDEIKVWDDTTFLNKAKIYGKSELDVALEYALIHHISATASIESILNKKLYLQKPINNTMAVSIELFNNHDYLRGNIYN
jgi:ATP-dependent DNA helicase RecG